METKRSVRQWLKLSDDQIERFLTEVLPAKTVGVPGVRNAHGAVPADPKDDMIIAAALESRASYIISEDKHLLNLGEYQVIKILNREEFEAELDHLGVSR
jgi:predicted nucleic acid-binding protein